jgi:PAS domain S-box-containing protein
MFFDTDGSITMMNPRSCEMFGYDDEELLGQPVERLIPTQYRNKHVMFRQEYLEDPKPRSMGLGRDLLGLKKDGSTFPLEASLSYVENEGEQMIVAFITDITIRKNNERILEEQRLRLQEYTNELEKKVKIRTSELEHLNLGLQSQIQERKLAERALRQSLLDLKKAEKDILYSLEKEKELSELKSRFVSMASHEFRTPLTTIYSSANLILKYTDSDQQSSREKHVNRIKKSVVNLTNILNDFLSIEKLESGAQKVDFQLFNIDELVEEVLEEMKPTLKNGQSITYDTSNTDITSDPQILKNILINLISNASKYSREDQRIQLSSTINNGSIILSVKDDGIGIPEEDKKNMFERFFRAKNATNIKGTGLGLNIVKKYLELLNGHIEFKSEEGKGSEFSVFLPNS